MLFTFVIKYNFSYLYSLITFENLSYLSLVQPQVRVSPFFKFNFKIKCFMNNKHTNKNKIYFANVFLFKLYIPTV